MLSINIKTIAMVTGQSSEAQALSEISIAPTFYTGNRNAPLALVSVLKDGKPIDEALLQVSEDGRVTVARKKEEGGT